MHLINYAIKNQKFEKLRKNECVGIDLSLNISYRPDTSSASKEQHGFEKSTIGLILDVADSITSGVRSTKKDLLASFIVDDQLKKLQLP